jgi:hypothetical protein
MKKITLILLLSIILIKDVASAQSVRASIKPDVDPSTVGIYFRPDFSNNATYFSNLSITVAIPTITPSPLATITTGNINGLTWNAGLAGTGGTESPAPYAGFTFYTFTALFANTNPVTLVSETEILVAKIKFTSTSNNPSQVYLASLDNINGGSSLQRYTYIEMSGLSGPIGPLSPDPTSGGILFYGSSGLSNTGQFESNSPFVRTNALIVLPVKLTSFSAQPFDCSTKLLWKVDTEIGLNHYEIQYSSDAVQFNTIGKIAGKGDGSDYSFIYSKPEQGMGYYRLAIINNNGTTEYSATVKLKLNCDGKSRQVVIAPNPANALQGININLSGYSGVTYATLYSMEGKAISKTKLVNGNGSNKLDASQLAAGTYLVSISASDGTTTTQKLNLYR